MCHVSQERHIECVGVLLTKPLSSHDILQMTCLRFVSDVFTVRK